MILVNDRVYVYSYLYVYMHWERIEKRENDKIAWISTVDIHTSSDAAVKRWPGTFNCIGLTGSVRSTFGKYKHEQTVFSTGVEAQ